MSKFLLNLLVKIFKVFQKSKFQIKFERILFLELWSSSGFQPGRGHLPSSPTGPLSPSPLGLGLPACPTPPLIAARAHPTFFFLKPTERRHLLAPHRAGRHTLQLSKWPEHSTLITSHHPTDPLPKRLLMELHYAATSPLMAGRLCSSPRPYKTRPSTPPPSHYPGVLPFSFPQLLSSPSLPPLLNPPPLMRGPPPPRRLPTRGDTAI
jgi:hypothetical protein